MRAEEGGCKEQIKGSSVEVPGSPAGFIPAYKKPWTQSEEIPASLYYLDTIFLKMKLCYKLWWKFLLLVTLGLLYFIPNSSVGNKLQRILLHWHDSKTTPHLPQPLKEGEELMLKNGFI